MESIFPLKDIVMAIEIMKSKIVYLDGEKKDNGGLIIRLGAAHLIVEEISW